MQSFRRLYAPAALALSLALIAAGCSSDDDAATTVTTTAEGQTSMSSPAAAASRCQTTDLNASVADTNIEGVVQTVTIALENKTNSECSLLGYPQIAAFNETTPIVSQAGPIADSSQDGNPMVVTIAPRSSAYFDIQYPQQNAPAGDCPAVTRLTITPPDETNQLILPLTLDEIPILCRDTSLSVTAIRGTPQA